MRRVLMLALVISALLCSICSAATVSGKQADYKMTVTMDMTALMGAMGMPAAPKGAKAQSMPKPQPIVTTGKVIWSPGKSRTDMTNGYTKTKDTTLIDAAARKVYVLRPATKTALTMDMTDHPLLEGLLQGGIGGRGASLETPDYATTLQQLKATKGVTVKEIGSKKVNGYDCHGLELTIDMSQLKEAVLPGVSGKQDDQSNQLMNNAMAAMGPLTSDVWISDKYHVALKSLSKTKGMSMVMEMNNIKDWSGPDSTFAVPAGYTVKDMASLGAGMHTPTHGSTHQ